MPEIRGAPTYGGGPPQPSYIQDISKFSLQLETINRITFWR